MYWHGGMGPESLRQCDRCAQIWKSFAYVLGGGMGSERACNSATGGPKYGNHLHIHPGPCIGMGVWGLREPATVRQVCPNMETIYTPGPTLWHEGI